MPVQHITHPALTNGVSRQSPVLRLDSQAQEQKNYLSEITGGPKDRPSAQLLTLPAGAAFQLDAFNHEIDRDDEEKYQVWIPGDGTVRVFDEDGVEQTVNAISPAAQAYLTCIGDPRRTFRAHSVVDTTFVTNREVDTEIDTSVRSALEENIALFWVRQTADQVTFTVKMKHAYAYNATAPDTPWRSGDLFGSNSNPSYHNDNIVVDYDTPDHTLVLRVTIAQAASNKEDPASWTNWAARRVVQGLQDMIDEHIASVGGDAYGRSMRTWVLDIPPATAVEPGSEQQWQALRGSVFWLRSSAAVNDEEVRFSVDDGLGGEAFKVAHRSVEKLSDLPGSGAPTGFKIKIEEATGDDLDDWYAEYDGSTWKESIGFDVPLGFDADTMPHVLRREANGTFTFEAAAWDVRTAGDAESVPDPGFIGKPIQKITVFKNRLALVYEDGVMFSESGDFLNFWKTTTRQILSADPFDISVDAGGGAAKYEDAIPFNRGLLMWSRTSQAVVQGTDVFTVETVSADVATDYKADLSISPLSTGSTLLFQSPVPNIWEYAASRGGDVYFGVDITAHLPNYLPGVFSWGSVSRAHNIAVFGHDSDRSKVWVYRYFFDEEKKIQSSWSTWEFGGDVEIAAGGFLNCQLLLAARVTTGAGNTPTTVNAMLRVCLQEPTETGFDWPVRLDLKKTSIIGAGAYNAPLNRTTVLCPYTVGVNDGLVAVLGEGAGDRKGEIVNVIGAGSAFAYLPGQVAEGAEVHVGFRYERMYEPSKLVLRLPDYGSPSPVPVTNRRVQVRSAVVRLQNAGYMKGEVYRDSELLASEIFTPIVVGGPLGQIHPADSAEFHVPIGTNAEGMRLVLTNDSYLPCEILSISYEALYHNKSRRLK